MKTFTCLECGKVGACISLGRRFCAQCSSAREKRFGAERRAHTPPVSPRRTPDERWKELASLYVQFAKVMGVLPRLGDPAIRCVDCGDIAVDYDHRDYSQPLSVDPVCRRCNLLRGSAKAPTYKTKQAA